MNKFHNANAHKITDAVQEELSSVDSTLSLGLSLKKAKRRLINLERCFKGAARIFAEEL